MAKICPKCGVARQVLESHIDTRPCRAAQVQAQMRERRLYPLHNLTFNNLLRWADLAYERLPARVDRSNRQSAARTAQLRKRLLSPTPDYTGALYKDLGELLFVEEWVLMLFKHEDILVNTKKARLGPLIKMLRGVQNGGNEFKQALVAVQALGGDPAARVMLEEVGLWNL